MSIKEIDQERYKEIREDVLSEEIPTVNFYKLGEEGQVDQLVESLRNLPRNENVGPWASNYSGHILTEALSRGILVDRFDFQLEDLAATRKPEGYFEDRQDVLDKYTRRFDTLGHGTVVEYPWKIKGRFVKVLDEDPFNELMYSRNRFVIPDEAQERLAQTKYAVAGLAVGGDAGYLLMMTGVKKWVIADGGLLDLHDFNRVIGSKVEDIGKNQANRWARMALEHNPYLDITVHPKNLGGDGEPGVVTYDDFLEGVDRVIEAVDKMVVKAELRLRGDVVMPTDMGLAAKLDVENQDKPFHGKLSEAEMNLLLESDDIDMETKTALAVKIVGLENVPPEYLQAMAAAKEEGVSYWPQPGVAPFLAASMLVASEVGRLSGKEQRDEIVVNLENKLFE